MTRPEMLSQLDRNLAVAREQLEDFQSDIKRRKEAGEGSVATDINALARLMRTQIACMLMYCTLETEKEQP